VGRYIFADFGFGTIFSIDAAAQGVLRMREGAIVASLRDMDSDVGNDQASRARHIRENGDGREAVDRPGP
jgi:hypothetical protein